jgi:alanine racemase
MMEEVQVAPAPTRLEVNLDHVRHNLAVLWRRAGTARVMAVVKANAYGLGAVPVAKALVEAGVEDFAVATLPEAIELRTAGLEANILVLGAPVGQDVGIYARYRLGLTLTSSDIFRHLAVAGERAKEIPLHVKVDTGMGRIGIRPESLHDVLSEAARGEYRIAGVWTHLATADEVGAPFTDQQIHAFSELVEGLDPTRCALHIANSGAVLAMPDSLSSLGAAYARLGISVYGVNPLDRPDAIISGENLLPVARFVSRITQVKWVEQGTPISYGCRWMAPRRTRIATVSAGYADGYRRAVSDRAEVGIGGQRYPVAGTVCMDMFMVDIGPGDDADHIAPGDEVVLFGPGGPDLREFAGWADTIPYEILCGIGQRVERRYVGKK